MLNSYLGLSKFISASLVEFYVLFLLGGIGLTPGSSQDLCLTLSSRITFGGAGGPFAAPEMEPSMYLLDLCLVHLTSSPGMFLHWHVISRRGQLGPSQSLVPSGHSINKQLLSTNNVADCSR